MDAVYAVFLGAGVGGWSYSKLARSSGNANPGSTAGVAVIIGLAAAIICFTLFKFILHI